MKNVIIALAALTAISACSQETVAPQPTETAGAGGGPAEVPANTDQK